MGVSEPSDYEPNLKIRCHQNDGAFSYKNEQEPHFSKNYDYSFPIKSTRRENILDLPHIMGGERRAHGPSRDNPRKGQDAGQYTPPEPQ